MIALLLLAALQAPAVETPPADWTGLPSLPLPENAGERITYARAEVAAGRCKAEVLPDGRSQIVAPVALLLSAEGTVRRALPQAIDCPTVEQYTAGYVSTMVRTGTLRTASLRPGWYKATIIYQW
ncbi:hypothetical protein [uncultured Sphingomonas sp.]|uniref:hypothetical protein n=1 Tax=Sphingomonas sp. TaxID=28214 RepID=UPI00262AE34F|nr:hypothetical protein [uncultured Sphingomonas sp.]